MNLCAWFLARRYLQGARHQNNISLMILICFTGIFIGSFSLALVLSIMRGFEKVTHERLKNVHAHLIMRGYGDDLNVDAIVPIFKQEFPEIVGYSPTIFKYGMVQNPDIADDPHVVMIKAIDPIQEAQTTTLEKKVIKTFENQPATLANLIHDDMVIIGKRLAEALHAVPGDFITLFFTVDEQHDKRTVTFNQRTVSINGTFDTGIEEFDSTIVICSLSLMQELAPTAGVEQINIALAHHVPEERMVTTLRDRFHLEVYSWKELYPALVSALKLEKYVMFLILILITLVASMNIISLLFMHITQKRGDIAILKSLGMNDATIVSIFVAIGLTITTSATIAGLICAVLVGWLLRAYPLNMLPDAYYVTHLPISLEWHLFALVFFVVFILGFLATWIPAHRTRTINIAQVLRFDA